LSGNDLCSTKVDKLDHPVMVKQDVCDALVVISTYRIVVLTLRFDIAMDHTRFMKIC
jgi:hypothetical protein